MQCISSAKFEKEENYEEKGLSKGLLGRSISNSCAFEEDTLEVQSARVQAPFMTNCSKSYKEFVVV